MKYDFIFKAVVKNNELEFTNKPALKRILQPLENKVLDIVIKQGGRLRSSQQNRYYWGVVLDIISQDLGYTPQECHALFKSMFLSKEILVKGKMCRITGSSKKLKISDFCTYIDRIIQWAGENSIVIPPSDSIDL